MAISTPPPGMMRMGQRFVPISRPLGASQKKTKKFLIALSYYEGDREIAEDLMTLIADLERTRNRETDVMLIRRADAREFSSGVVAKLKLKFDNVLLHTCRRTDAKGYPFGCNQMFCDLVSLIWTNYRGDYFAFSNLESDITPTRPGWIAELIAAWHFSNDRGKGAIGHIEDNPIRHLNGVAVYAADIAGRVGGNRLIGCGPQVCYDIAFAKMMMPHAADTPLIAFEYRKPNITAVELFAAKKEGIIPALYHGVKDGSARAAVRARHITFSEKLVVLPKSEETLQVSSLTPPVEPMALSSQTAPENTPVKRPNVYTYASGQATAEAKAIIEAWRKGWASRGWNPVVLTIREAAKHSRFDEFSAAIEKLPYVGDRKNMAHRFYRWLALDLSGGGLMVDSDVLPRDLTPNKIAPEGGPMAFYSDPLAEFVGLWLSPVHSKMWINHIIAYDAQPDDLLADKSHVSDETIVRHASLFDGSLVGTTSPLIASFARLSSQEIGALRVSVSMEKFLEGQ